MTDTPTGPEVSLEWDANDEGPPCIDFTCLCGHWQHLCNGPDWITEGIGQVPGVKCVKCGTAWSLYRVRITTMIRQVAGREPDRWSVPGGEPDAGEPVIYSQSAPKDRP